MGVRGIHTWGWWEAERKIDSIFHLSREKETCASDASLLSSPPGLL